MNTVINFFKSNKIVTLIGAVVIAAIAYFVPGSEELADKILDNVPGAVVEQPAE